MWESMHSSPDLDMDVSIFGDFGGNIVLLEKIFGEVAEFETHVFVAGHRGIEVKIFDVNSHELISRGGDDTVEEELQYEDIYGGRAIFMKVV